MGDVQGFRWVDVPSNGRQALVDALERDVRKWAIGSRLPDGSMSGIWTGCSDYKNRMVGFEADATHPTSMATIVIDGTNHRKRTRNMITLRVRRMPNGSFLAWRASDEEGRRIVEDGRCRERQEAAVRDMPASA